MNKKYFIFFIILFSLVLISAHLETISKQSFIFAQGNLEVEYIDIPGITKPTTRDLNTYLIYFYAFGIFFAGFVSFALLIWAGLKYTTASANPTKIKDAREQIAASLLGLLIVFGSYIILNTINPDFLEIVLPVVIRPIARPVEPPIILSSDIRFQEIPVGTLITSEVGVSSFIATSTATATDPDTLETDNYNIFFSDVFQYPTDYQGGLHGRRLKRIHEVASTTLPVVDRIIMLSERLQIITSEFRKLVDELKKLANECSCKKCECVGCSEEKDGICTPNICPPCSGDPCGEEARERMRELREELIPGYFQQNTNVFPCKMVILDYFASAFQPFLDGNKQLVCIDEDADYFDDYRDNSYCHEGEGLFSGDHVDDMRTQIRACIGAGTIDNEEFEAVEELIQMMAGVENKGTYTTTTTPPERDVWTEISHMEKNLILLEKSKNALNPEHEMGCWPQAYTLHQKYQIADSLAIDILNVKVENVRVIEDPATFYCPLNPFEREGPHVFLGDIPTGAPCSPMVEIPIGNTIDDSIKLMADILKALGDPMNVGVPRYLWDPALEGKQGLWNKGKGIISEAVKQVTSASSTIDLTIELIDLTSDDNCETECSNVPCISKCVQGSRQVCTKEDVDGNCIESVTVQTYRCTNCEGKHPCPKNEINAKYGKIIEEINKINNLYIKIKELKKIIYESFFKLNSEYPEEIPHQGEWMAPEDTGIDPDWEAGERVTIGEDVCCEDPEGDCRDPNNIYQIVFANDKAVKREYTLKEKLISIQKLLNRTRDFKIYKILIDELIAMDLDFDSTVLEEYTNIPKDYMRSLSDCDSVRASWPKVVEGKMSRNLLKGCWFVKSKEFEHIMPQHCNPGPPYDCDYFNPLIRRKTPLLCRCFDEFFFPKIANNVFCCHMEYSW